MKAHPDIVAIGASSGGIEALQSLLEALSDLDAIVLVVLHRPANRASYFPISFCETSTCQWWCRGTESRYITRSATSESLRSICWWERLFMLTYCPTTGTPPATSIRLFISLARHYGPRTIGVALSDDGTRGLAAIKKAGGITMVQSPQEAAYPDMPRNAITYDGPVDLVAPIRDLAAEIVRLTKVAPAKQLA
jgi:two-component system, chemotaxis family, protein-glutamate methylesterase/glutaminase